MNAGDDAAEQKFKEVNEAYEVLGDEQKRKEYDNFGSGYQFTGGQNFDPRQYGYDGASYTYTSGEGGGDFSDFFNLIFGKTGFGTQGGGSKNTARDFFSGFGGSRSQPRNSYETSLTITLEEAYHGTEKVLNLDLDGAVKTVRIKVPKGIQPGKKIKIKGEKFGIPGDLMVKLDVVMHGRTLEGLNVVTQTNIYPWDAALGSDVIVDTLAGKVKVKIPKGIESGKRIRISGKGFTDMKGKTGDHYLLVRIKNPSHLSEEQLKLYEQLKAVSQ